MIIVIDTNVLVNAFQNQELDHLSITMLFNSHELKLGFDFTNFIRQEYDKNVGKLPLYRKWIQRLEEKLAMAWHDGKLSERHRTKLSQCGCHEPSDHVFIAVAFNADKILVSEDSDIGKGAKGHEPPHPQALQYLQQVMGLQVYDAPEFLTKINLVKETS